MKKTQLRKYYQDKRKQLTTSDLQDMSLKIGNLLVQNLAFSNKLVHIFLPIRKFNEIDTYIVRDIILETFPQCRFALSRSNFETGEMENMLWESDTVIAENPYGIPEPETGGYVVDNEIDVVLIPLLAFDHKGSRIGYGKGFYDRFLCKCRPDCVFAGISHFPPCNEVIVADDWDVALDMCFTPERVYRFG